MLGTPLIWCIWLRYFDIFPSLTVSLWFSSKMSEKIEKIEKIEKNRKNIYIYFLNQAISIGNRLKKTLEKTSSYNMQPKKSCVGWKLGRSIRKNERKKSKKSKKIEKNNFFSNQARSIGNRLKKTLEKKSSYNMQPKKSWVGWKLGRSVRKNELLFLYRHSCVFGDVWSFVVIHMLVWVWPKLFQAYCRYIETP